MNDRKLFFIVLFTCIAFYLIVGYALADDRARQLGALFACGCPCCF